MKKSFVIAAILSAAMSVSCNTAEIADIQNEMPDNETGMQTITISASVEPGTKTSYADGITFSWTAGDKISVYCSDEKFYEFTSTSTGATSTFIGSIPEDVTIGKYAFFPAESGHAYVGGGSYKFSIPEYKDLTSHPSADMPMIGNKGEGMSYSFMHCSGAALLTVSNIPSKFTSVELSISNASLKFSGLFGVYMSGGVWTYSAASAADESEKTFTRKVAVEDNTAQVYFPYASDGDLWAAEVLNVIGFDSSNNATVFFKDKAMKALRTFSRATVKPLAVLPINNLAYLDWTGAGIEANSGDLNNGIIEWKATSDPYNVYINYKITASKISWDETNLTYDKKYIYVGFDYAEGGNAVGGGVVGDDWEAMALVYPFTGATEGTIEFKDGDDGRSNIKCPADGSSISKVTTTGYLDGNYAYVSISVPRSKIGSPASGTTLNIQSAFDWYPTSIGSITLQ